MPTVPTASFVPASIVSVGAAAALAPSVAEFSSTVTESFNFKFVVSAVSGPERVSFPVPPIARPVTKLLDRFVAAVTEPVNVVLLFTLNRMSPEVPVVVPKIATAPANSIELPLNTAGEASRAPMLKPFGMAFAPVSAVVADSVP